MKEIKFRAWDKRMKKMCEVFSLFLKTDGKLTAIGFRQESGNPNCNPNDMELMQFTGLKDKNGKEIYCGDVVFGYFNVDELSDSTWLSLSQNEREVGSKIFIIPEDIIDFAQTPLPDKLEVIGNVYENPELLK